MQVGSLRIRAKLGEIQRKSDAAAAAETDNQKGFELISGRTRRIKQMAENMSATPGSSNTAAALGMVTPSMELDLRGQRAEDALLMLDNYLDKAYLGKLLRLNSKFHRQFINYFTGISVNDQTYCIFS